jgi:hypothetical protein
MIKQFFERALEFYLRGMLIQGENQALMHQAIYSQSNKICNQNTKKDN